MANTAKNAILRAKLNGVLTELLVKTNAANVIVDDQDTTLAAHLLTLAKQSDLDALQQIVDGLGALATKDKVSVSDFDEALTEWKTTLDTNAAELWDGVVTLVGEDGGKSVRTIANEELAAQLIGENAKESLDTLAEIAAWIQSHPDDASAMNQAITALQNKVVLGTNAEGTEYATVKAYVEAAIAALNIGDYATAASLTELAGRVTTAEGEIDALQDTVNALGDMATKDVVTESDLDSALAEKVNAASEGNHAHLNKDLLDTYDQTNADLKDAVAKKHSHANATVLDGITAENVTAWDGKATIYYAAEEPAAMVEGDLWVQIVE